MEGGSAPPEEDFSKLPLEDRLLHKVSEQRAGACLPACLRSDACKWRRLRVGDLRPDVD